MNLKAFYGKYARPAFRLSEADAYELQRVLATIKAFPRGRPGPGGGAPATAFSVTMFTIAVMADGPRRRADVTAFDYHELLQEGSILAGWGEKFEPTIRHCPFTGEKFFGKALRRIFESPPLAERIREIVVVRDWPEALIRYRDADDADTEMESRFVGEHDPERLGTSRLPGALVTRCTLGGPIIHLIALDLANSENAEWTGS